MNSFTRRSAILCAAVAGLAFAIPAEAATGRLSLNIVSGGFIVGVAGGSGFLTFKGKQYPLTVGGVSAGAIIGASSADLVGTASKLHDVHDIEGTYSAFGGGVAAAGGAAAVQLVNSHGVVLRLSGRQIGFKLSVALSGMQLTLK